MILPLVTLFGAVAFGMLLLGIHVWLLASSVQTEVVIVQAKKLLSVDNRKRVVILCDAAGPQAADCQLILFLLGLELPRHTLPDSPTGGYRSFLPEHRFEDRLEQLVAERAPFFYRMTNRRGMAAVVAGLAAAGLAVATYLLGERFGSPLVALGLVNVPDYSLLFGAGVVLLVTLSAARRWRKTMAGKSRVLAVLLPFVRPLEEMAPTDLAAAAAAREVLDRWANRALRHRVNQPLASSTARQPVDTTAQPLEEPAGRVCPNCGRMNPPHYKFCLGCGVEVRSR